MNKSEKIKTLSLLQAARLLITSKKNWTRKVCARNEFGTEVDVRSPNAVSWCSYGAILACSNGGQSKIANLANNRLDDGADGCYITINDKLGHAAALKVFDKAIETLALEIDGAA